MKIEEEKDLSLDEQVKKHIAEVAVYATLIQSKEFAFYRQILQISVDIQTREIMDRAFPNISDGIKGVAVDAMQKGMVKGLRMAIDWPERMLSELREQIDMLQKTIAMREEEAEDEEGQE